MRKTSALKTWMRMSKKCGTSVDADIRPIPSIMLFLCYVKIKHEMLRIGNKKYRYLTECKVEQIVLTHTVF